MGIILDSFLWSAFVVCPLLGAKCRMIPARSCYKPNPNKARREEARCASQETESEMLACVKNTRDVLP